MNTFAVIMAGGRGQRFWPMGRKKQPKQLLKLLDDQTMLEATLNRLHGLVPPENTIVVTNIEFQAEIRRLLPIPPENVLAEPVGRNTAPCVALAAAFIRRRLKSDDAAMILLPADHVIRPAEELREILQRAVAVAQQPDALVTIGLRPTYPATGYGYIHLGEQVEYGFNRVLEFKEKPDALTAENYIASGDYRWNSGIFVWRVETIYQEFVRHCPALSRFIDDYISAPEPETFLAEAFPNCPNISIDYAILEKAGHVYVGNADFYWNDIGSWSSLRTLLSPDADGNVGIGKYLTIDTHDSVIIGDEDMLVGVIGMEQVAVIKSGNGILVCPLSQEQRVRELVEKMALTSERHC